VYEHFVSGKESKPMEADKPGGESSGEFVFVFVRKRGSVC
jgi:hypothetical protein